MALSYSNNEMDSTAAVYKKTTLLWVFFLLAAASFLTTLGLPYIGEEAVYTISSLEMWHRNEWIRPFLYGTNYGRPPLYNWFIILVTEIIGWNQVLLASRLVTAFSTIATGSMMIWFVNRISRNQYLALFCALLYFSGDLLVWRGWHAYSDPLFALFVFSAVACLWVAVNERRTALLVYASAALIASFLSKAMTGYVFYLVAILALLRYHPNRAWLFSKTSIFLHLLSFCFPFLWNMAISNGAHGIGMIWDVTSKYSIKELLQYLNRLMIFPLETILCTLPGAGLLLFFWLQSNASERKSIVEFHKPVFAILCWILILNFLPYWLAPETRIRYLAPWYPFFAIFLAHAIFRLGTQKIRITLYSLTVCLILKYGLSIWAYPYYEKRYGEKYAAIAEDILFETQKKPEYPLYTENDSSTGLSVTALINIERFPNAPLVRAPQDSKECFLIGGTENIISNATIMREYEVGDKKIYLLCKGKACE